MNSAVSLERSLKREQREAEPWAYGESHGTCEETGKQHGRISRYKGSGMYEKCSSELERPYLSPKGKEKAYKLGENVFLMEGSRRGT